MEDKEKYIAQLEETIRQFLKPLKNVPFKVAMRAISGHVVVPFDKANREDAELLELLVKAARIATRNAAKSGIESSRANEVGNKIEPFVTRALNEVGLRASRPKTGLKKTQATGYPDVFVVDTHERPSYLECKTYNEKNYQTTQRSFYFSPPQKEGGFKVTEDARHLILSFKIEKGIRDTRSVYVPTHWKVFSIDNLIGQIKHEYNASNKQVYRVDALLAEGST